ncbi:MAG: D-amino acid dehydrogenase [Gammaproteobacteria bacterium]
MRCLVVGAGLLGLTTAWFLRRHGVEVTVCDRAPGPGLETSFANGGMLHASQASPWNEPGVLRRALLTLGQEDSALLIRPRALPRMLGWTWAFFRNSAPRRFLVNLNKNTRLADYSLSVLNEHLANEDLAFERADLGTLKVYRSDAELAEAVTLAERCREWNVAFEVLDRDRISALEPALAGIAAQLSGGIHFPGDVSGDAQLFCRALAARAAEAGVRFRFEAAVDALLLRDGRLCGASIDGEHEHFDACVVAAGSHSPGIVRTAGLRLPVQPVKGYSLTLPMDNWAPAPRVPVIDEHYHAAVCPLGGQLRVAGTAEFAGFDAALTRARLDNLYRLVEHVYPHGAAVIEPAQATEWTGFRPMSPDGVGIMGQTTVPGLYLNTGHGHLGWTMAPGAGKLVADAVCRHEPELDLSDYALARFG